MTVLDLDEIERRLRVAERPIIEGRDITHAEFITVDMPALIARVRELEGDLEAALAARDEAEGELEALTQ